MILCTRCGICMRRGLNLPCIASWPSGPQDETKASTVPGEAKRGLSMAGVTCIQRTAHCLSARSARDVFQPPAHPCSPGNPHHWKRCLQQQQVQQVPALFAPRFSHCQCR